MDIQQEVAKILDQTLSLQGRSQHFERGTTLLGSLPELDSMAVVTILTALEEHFGFSVEDDEISAETFSSFGALVDFVNQKLA